MNSSQADSQSLMIALYCLPLFLGQRLERGLGSSRVRSRVDRFQIVLECTLVLL